MDGPVRVRGQRLNYAASSEDYRVNIGTEKCEIGSFSSDLITCSPPEDKPGTASNYITHNNMKTPHIEVRYAK